MFVIRPQVALPSAEYQASGEKRDLRWVCRLHIFYRHADCGIERLNSAASPSLQSAKFVIR